MSDNIIALMPWFLILDSTPRLEKLISFGLKSITALPRSTFKYTRIQCCIFELSKGYKGPILFQAYGTKISNQLSLTAETNSTDKACLVSL